MAWLQVHQTIKDHRKLLDAADALEIAPPHMMGMLISFWLWALDNAPSGKLSGISSRMIARAAQWDGEAEKLVETLIYAGWLDENEDRDLEIHDWYEYAGKLIDQRTAEKNRSQRRRAAAAAVKQPQDDHQATAGQPPDDRRSTDKRPQDDRQTTAGRVEKSRVEKSIDNIIPPTPSSEAGDGDNDIPKKSLIEERFAEFWAAYPKKVGKQNAIKAWNKIKPSAELHARIMGAVSQQKRSEDWIREHGRFIPHPTTWLNGGYWDNEEVIINADQRHEQSDRDTGRNWTPGFKSVDDDFGY